MCAFIKKVNKTLRILRKWGVLLLYDPLSRWCRHRKRERWTGKPERENGCLMERKKEAGRILKMEERGRSEWEERQKREEEGAVFYVIFSWTRGNCIVFSFESCKDYTQLISFNILYYQLSQLFPTWRPTFILALMQGLIPGLESATAFYSTMFLLCSAMLKVHILREMLVLLEIKLNHVNY